MEKEAFFGGGGDHQLPNCFLNLNWDQSADHAAAQFESALSSLVSSPSSNAPPSGAGAAADSVVIRELIGRLGSICNSGEISPPSQFQSTTTSCYSTPLNSPPKLNLMPPGGGVASNPMAFAAANPGFAERAARFSCFGGGGARSCGQLGGLSRVSSSQSLKSMLPAMDGAQLDQNERRSGGTESGNGQEEPSIASDRGKASGTTESGGGGGGRKRKAAAATPKGKGKEAPLTPMEEDSSGGTKRCKSGEAEAKAEKEDNAKPVEPPKLDYIHVRARRGQATDSHSLAERVRREKISERMKFLQDLVPGCNKVTGKAVMLDEIINYVQSLQRQVEFLSMKLSTVNPRLEFNVDGLVDGLVQKDMHQPRGPVAAAAPPHSVFPMEGASAAAEFPYGNQPQMLPLQSLMAGGMEGHGSANALDAATLRRSLGMQLPNMDSFMDASSQLGAFWEDDLQSVVQMGFGQNLENVFSSQAFQGSAPTNHMKIEL